MARLQAMAEPKEHKPEHAPGEEFRCVCNKLLWIQRGDDIEIKCPKCKRLITIHTKGVTGIDVE